MTNASSLFSVFLKCYNQPLRLILSEKAALSTHLAVIHPVKVQVTISLLTLLLLLPRLAANQVHPHGLQLLPVGLVLLTQPTTKRPPPTTPALTLLPPALPALLLWGPLCVALLDVALWGRGRGRWRSAGPVAA